MPNIPNNLTIKIEKEDDVYVSICPENNVSSYGDNPIEAIHMIAEALELWYEDEVEEREEEKSSRERENKKTEELHKHLEEMQKNINYEELKKDKEWWEAVQNEKKRWKEGFYGHQDCIDIDDKHICRDKHVWYSVRDKD